MSDTKMLRRVQVFIGREASDALDRIVKRGMSQREAIEAALIAADQPPKFLGAILPDEPERKPEPKKDTEAVIHEAQRKLEARRVEFDPEREAGAIQVRAERKAARVGRKAELAQAVTAALPARTPEEILASAQAKIDQQRRSYCPTHRPKWCPDDCKHRIET